MVRRRLLQAVITLLLGTAGAFVAVQPASAAVVPVGKPGNVCSGYNYIDSARSLYYQTCTWTSWNPPNSRIWFTVHFGNKRANAVTIDAIDIGYHVNGSGRYGCLVQYNLVVPARGTKASTDQCWFDRVRASVQSSAIVHEGSYTTSPPLLSPTLSIQG